MDKAHRMGTMALGYNVVVVVIAHVVLYCLCAATGVIIFIKIVALARA